MNYLRAENVDRYRIIIRYFFEQYEKIQYCLYKEDVLEAMMQTGLFPDYTLDQCQSDLGYISKEEKDPSRIHKQIVNTYPNLKNKDTLANDLQTVFFMNRGFL